MPYSIVNDHPECDGFAVIKDEGRELLGCHRTQAQAQDQLTAINISEYGNRELPDNYRPASSADVPEGRNCANCYFYEAGYCSLWEDNVEADYYCNRWAQIEERQDGYTPTSAMRAEAERGLAWRREFGRGGTEVGVARARDISNGRALSLDTVRRMVSFFARHEVDKRAEGFSPGEDGYPSNGRIAWALWGGDAGQSWANRISKQNETRLEKAKAILQSIKKKDIE
jgi:hypothetical protein